MPGRDGTNRAQAFLDSLDFELDPDLRINEPVVAEALAAWDRLRGDRAMPALSDLDVVDLPRLLLPHLLLLDIERDPVLRFRWRLIGTHTTAALGRDSTGRYWDELYDERGLDMLKRGPLWVLEHKRPVRILGRAVYADKAHVHSESIDLPLSRDGTAVDRILIAAVYRIH